jgi:uncharacterized protein YdaU (DUF1376 family)
MPLWISDFLGDTLDLDAREIGAYMLLLMAMWQRGGALPSDPKKLCRIARAGRGWPKTWAAIERFFVTQNDVIVNNRLSAELQKVDTKRRVNAHAGALGGKAKSLKANTQGLANATVSLYQPEPYPESKSSVSKDTGSDDPPDLKKIAFDGGIKLLAKSGVSERKARPLLGRWIRDHGEAEVISALSKAHREGAIDCVSFVEGCFKFTKRAKEPEIGDRKTYPNGKVVVWNGRSDGWVRVNEDS